MGGRLTTSMFLAVSCVPPSQSTGSIMKIRALLLFSATWLAMLAQSGDASADDPSQFYSDREIKLVIGSAPGGGYDSYSRLLAKHMVRFVPPGTARIVTINMPGAGGIRAANW